MSEKVKSKKQRIIYYCILAVMIVLVGVVTVIAATGGNNSNTTIDNTPKDTATDTGGSSDETPTVEPDDSEKVDDDNKDNEPVAEVISFISPVKGGTCFKEYTDNSVIYSSTLGVYTGHTGMDFKGEENAQVVAVYKGTIKEISTSYLKGTTIKIDHGSGLYTIYNSVEPLENLKAGMTVLQGDVIGTVSENNKQEYKDGPHLHFEVVENDKTISPLKYLTIEEK